MHLLCLQSRFSNLEQFRVLHERYPLVSNSTKGLLLSTYLKMLLADPSNSTLQAEVTAVFSKNSHQMDPDLQQRSAEYLVGVWAATTGPAVTTTTHMYHTVLQHTNFCLNQAGPA